MRSRSISLSVAALAAAGVVATAGCSGSGGGQHADGFAFHGANTIGTLIPAAQRRQAGDFTAKRLDGDGTFALSQTAGKVVVVNYWASDCVPCRTEMPEFNRIYSDERADGVTFVGVDTKDIAARGRLFLRQNHIGYPNLYDKTGRTALEIGDIAATALPFTVLIDRSGDVAGVYLGELTGAQLTPMLATLRRET